MHFYKIVVNLHSMVTKTTKRVQGSGVQRLQPLDIDQDPEYPNPDKPVTVQRKSRFIKISLEIPLIDNGQRTTYNEH